MAKLSYASCLLLLLVTIVPGSRAQGSNGILPSPSPTNPNGSELTALQKYVKFFDKDGDGPVDLKEAYQGLRTIGLSLPMATMSTLIINNDLNAKTSDGTKTSKVLPVFISNIKKGKHRSGTGAYDIEGRFVPERFEAIFQKHAHHNPNALTNDKLKKVIKTNRAPKDYRGSIGGKLAWELLHLLARGPEGLLRKETSIVYDGNLFHQLEKSKQSRKQKSI